MYGSEYVEGMSRDGRRVGYGVMACRKSCNGFRRLGEAEYKVYGIVL